MKRVSFAVSCRFQFHMFFTNTGPSQSPQSTTLPKQSKRLVMQLSVRGGGSKYLSNVIRAPGMGPEHMCRPNSNVELIPLKFRCLGFSSIFLILKLVAHRQFDYATIQLYLGRASRLMRTKFFFEKGGFISVISRMSSFYHHHHPPQY